MFSALILPDMRKSTPRDTVSSHTRIMTRADETGQTLRQVKRTRHPRHPRSSLVITFWRLHSIAILSDNCTSIMYQHYFLLRSLGAYLGLDMIDQFPRTVTDREREFAFWDLPELFLHIPYREVFLALPFVRTELTNTLFRGRTDQSEFYHFAFPSFEEWFLVPPQMLWWLFDLGTRE